MDLTPDQAASAVERRECPKCEAPPGSPCRTLGGKTASRYHTPRFILVPALREDLEVLVPADRLPLRPKPARILRPGGPPTAEESDLRERLVAQRAQLAAADRKELAP
ncbi:hypothetical protein [Streptomyces sp. NPDC059533]|uniref:zinc finger domain-containing protein n=1 Tax=unclassified Streptomyces TaxID=2593676 RepID=UPI0036A59C1E